MKLLPGRYSEDVCCEMYTRRLEDRPEYWALSYCWGSDVIEVNGERGFGVTQSLESALRRVRDERVNRILWIDAVCIRQANYAEKNAQVRLMRLIYENARRVCIWLGELSEFKHENPIFQSQRTGGVSSRRTYWPSAGRTRTAHALEVRQPTSGFTRSRPQTTPRDYWWDRVSPY